MTARTIVATPGQPGLVTPRADFGTAPVGADPSHTSTWWPANILQRTNSVRQAPGWTGGMPDAVMLGDPTVATVNHGRWVADCPTCLAAQVVDPADPRFWCPLCQPAGWRPITFPDDVHAIADLLLQRPAPQTRNWIPGESLDQLAAENEHGGPVALDAGGPHAIAPGTILHPNSEWA